MGGAVSEQVTHNETTVVHDRCHAQVLSDLFARNCSLVCFLDPLTVLDMPI